MGDLTEKESSQSVKVTGSGAAGAEGTYVDTCNDALKSSVQGFDGVHCADVFLEDGVRKLQTNATATIESLFGEAVFPFTAIKVLTIGSNGDTIRTQIPDDSIDVTTTKTASETTDNDLAKKHRDELNADGNFSPLYRASVPRDSNIICIEALLVQTIRPDSGDVVLIVTGGVTATLVWDKIVDQSLALALFPHPRDCTKGTISVVGEIGVTETGRPPKRLFLQTAGFSSSMRVNGSVTPVVFKLTNSPLYEPARDMIVTELRIEATGNSLTNGDAKYIAINPLTNGHQIQIRSDGTLEYDQSMFAMHDIFHAFAIGNGSKFQLETGSNSDSLVAVFARPFFIRKVGSFGTPDDIIVTVKDDLTAASIKRLQMTAIGFFED